MIRKMVVAAALTGLFAVPTIGKVDATVPPDTVGAAVGTDDEDDDGGDSGLWGLLGLLGLVGLAGLAKRRTGSPVSTTTSVPAAPPTAYGATTPTDEDPLP